MIQLLRRGLQEVYCKPLSKRKITNISEQRVRSFPKCHQQMGKMIFRDENRKRGYLYRETNQRTTKA